MKINYFIEPPQGLFEKIMGRIRKEQRFLLIRNRIVFSVLIVGSAGLFWPALKLLLSDLSKTGFFSFLSLLLSDFSSIVNSWQNFSLVLLETLPIFSIILFLTVIAIFLESLKLLIKNKYEYRRILPVKTV